MTTRSRERRSNRLPAIWRGSMASATGEQQRPVQHGAQGRVFVSWRMFSGIIVGALVTVLFVFFGADAFYVHSVAVGGLRYMTKEDVFGLADIANTHLFWVDPAQVRASILRSPTIADAVVTVNFPPQMVRIVVQEREPAVVWEQAGVATWIDLQGRVMRQWEDRPDLLRISADALLDTPLGPEQRIDPAVVSGALQLHTLYPNVAILRYHPEDGLGFSDPRGWTAWLGTGTNMPEKILIYNAIVENVQARGLQPSEINVVNPDAPFYCGSIDGCAGP